MLVDTAINERDALYSHLERSINDAVRAVPQEQKNMYVADLVLYVVAQDCLERLVSVEDMLHPVTVRTKENIC